jgi:TusA-related sulfurtransferase
MGHDADAVLDLKGLTCPGPLLAAKRMVDSLEENQVLLLVSDCPGTHADLLSWTRQTGNRLLRTEKNPAGGMGYYIQKGSWSHVPEPNATLDMRGVTCPGPIVEAKKLLGGMREGETLKLVSNCPGVRDDIGGWASAAGMTLLDTVESAAGEYAFFIRKG